MKRSDYMVENDGFIHVIVFVFHFISEESVSDLRFYLYQIQMYKMQ